MVNGNTGVGGLGLSSGRSCVRSGVGSTGWRCWRRYKTWLLRSTPASYNTSRTL
jgi:hypothetical protein